MAGNDGTVGAAPAPAGSPDQPRRRSRGGSSSGSKTGIIDPSGRPGAVAAGLVLEACAADGFAVIVVGQDGASLLRLGPWHQDEVIAIWRTLAMASGLPLIISDGQGGREQPFQQIGRLHLGAVRMRRRCGLPSGRRPRFLVRRKSARLPHRPLIYRERELAGGRGA